MAQNTRINFEVGFHSDISGLMPAEKELQKIKSMTVDDYMKIHPEIMNGPQAIQELNKIKSSASELETALRKSFNPTLGTNNITQLNHELSKMKTPLNEIYRDMQKLGPDGVSAFRSMTSQAMSAKMQFQQTKTVIDKMGESLIKTGKWFISSSIINQLAGSVQEAYGYVKALDGSLNDIRIVTGDSAEEMDRFAQKANKAAKALGAATTDYTKAALIYRQQGLGEQETEVRTETTLKVANVTGQDANAVSEELTALWNGYQIGNDEIEASVDKLSAVAAMSASSLQELATGMSKVASAANSMGVTEDQLVATMSAIISVTRQAPESVGTALKTIYARMGDLSLDGEDEFGVKLGTVSGQLADLGINILDQEGNMRDMGVVMEEVAVKWDSWTEAQRTAAATAMAGKRQYNNLIALFDNWNLYEDALDASTNSLGTLQGQQDVYMESTEAHLQKLKTATEGIYDSLLDADSINGVADTLSTIARVVEDIVDGMGGGVGVLTTLSTILLHTFNGQISKELMSIANGFGASSLKAQEMEQRKSIIERMKTSGDSVTEARAGVQEKFLQYTELIGEEEQQMIDKMAEETAILTEQLELLEKQKKVKEEQAQQDKTKQDASRTKAELLMGTGKSKLFADSYDESQKIENSWSAPSRDAALATNKFEVANSKGYKEYIQLLQKAKDAQEKFNTADEEYGKSQTTDNLNKKRKALLDYKKALEEVNQKSENVFGKGLLGIKGDKVEKITEDKVSKNNNSQLDTKKDALDLVLEDAGKNLFGGAVDDIQKMENALDEVKVKAAEVREENVVPKDLKGGVKLTQPIENAFDQLKQKIKETENGTEIYGQQLKEIEAEFEKLKSSDWTTIDDFDQASIQAEHLQELIQKLAESLNMSEEEAKEFAASLIDGQNTSQVELDETNKKIQQTREQLDGAANSADKLANSLKKGKGIEVGLKGVQGLTSLGMTLSSVKGLMSTLKSDASGFDKFVSLLTTGGMAVSSLVSAFSSLSTVLTTVAGALGITAGVLGGIVVAIGAVVTAVVLLATAHDRKLKKALKESQEEVKRTTEEYDKMKDSYSSMISELEDYKGARDALDSLKEGTDEWYEALRNVNEQVDELIGKYPELVDYLEIDPETGEKRLSDEGIEKATELRREKVDNAQHDVKLAQNQETDDEINFKKNELAEKTGVAGADEEDIDKILNAYDNNENLFKYTDEILNELGIQISEKGEEFLDSLKFEPNFKEYQNEEDKKTFLTEKAGLSEEDAEAIFSVLETKTGQEYFNPENNLEALTGGAADLYRGLRGEIKEIRQEEEDRKKEKDNNIGFIANDFMLKTDFSHQKDYKASDNKVAIQEAATELYNENKDKIDTAVKDREKEMEDEEKADEYRKQYAEKVGYKYDSETDSFTQKDENGDDVPVEIEDSKIANYLVQTEQLFNLLDEKWDELVDRGEEIRKENDAAAAEKDTKEKQKEKKQTLENKDNIKEEFEARSEVKEGREKNAEETYNAQLKVEAAQRQAAYAKTPEEKRQAENKTEQAKRQADKARKDEQGYNIANPKNKTEAKAEYFDNMGEDEINFVAGLEIPEEVKQGTLDEIDDFIDEAHKQATIEVETSVDSEEFDSDVQTITDGFGKMGESYKKFSKQNQLSGADLTRLRKSLKGISEKEFNRYSEVLQDANASTEEVQKAWNGIADEWVNSQDVIDNLTAGTADLAAEEWELSGITNSVDVVTAQLVQKYSKVEGALALATATTFNYKNSAIEAGTATRSLEEAQEQLEKAELDVANGTQEEKEASLANVIALRNEAVAAGASSDSYDALIASLIQASEAGYEPDLSGMVAEGSAVKELGEMYKQLAAMKAAGADESAIAQQLDAIDARLETIKAQASITGAKYTAPSSNNDSGSSSKNKGSDVDRTEEFATEIDMYAEINAQIDALTKKIEKLQKAQSKLTGKALADNIKEQIKLQNELTEKIKKRQQMEQKELDSQKSVLKNKGFQFDNEGQITNYDEQLSKLQQSIYKKQKAIDKKVDKYNKKYGEDKEVEDNDKAKKEQDKIDKQKEELSNLENRYKEIEDLANTYTNNLINRAAQTAAELQEAYDNAINKKIEAFNQVITLQLDATELKRDFNSLIKELQLDLNNAFSNITIGKDVLINAEVAGQNLQTYKDKDLANSIASFQTAQNDYETIKNGGKGTVFGDNEAAAFDAMKENYGKIENAIRGIYEEQENLKQSYLDLEDAASEAFSQQANEYEAINNNLEHQLNLVTKLRGEDSYKELDKVYSTQLNNSLNSLDLYKKQLSYWENQRENMLKTFGKDSEQWKKANEEVLAAQQTYNTEIENSIDLVVNKYKNAIAEIFNTFETSITGSSFAIIDEEWEHFKEQQQRYLDSVNRTFQTQTFAYNANEAKENYKDNYKALKAIDDLRDSELARMEKMDKLSQNEVDYANLRLQILLKQIALEEARENKTKMRLKRDSQGNYSYVYTADENAIAKAAQDLQAEQNKLYNLLKTNITTVQENIFSSIKDFSSEAQSIFDEYSELGADGSYHLTSIGQKLLDDLVANNKESLNSLLEDLRSHTTQFKAEAIKEQIALGNITQQEWDALTPEQQEDKYNEWLGEITNGNYQMLQGFLTGEKNLDDYFNTIIEGTAEAATEATTNFKTIGKETGENLTDVETAVTSLNTATDTLKTTNNELVTSLKDTGKELDDIYEKYQTLVNYLNSQDFKTSMENIKIWGNTIAEAEEASAKEQKEASETEVKDPDSQNPTKEPNDFTSNGDFDANDLPIAESNFYYYNSVGDIGKTKKKAGTFKVNGDDGKLKDETNRTLRVTQVDTKNKAIKLKNLGWISMKKAKQHFKDGSYDTGGYTGDAPDNGGFPALLHRKELVLNAEDTKNMLSAVEILRQMTNNAAAAAREHQMTMLDTISKAEQKQLVERLQVELNDSNQELEQNVHIDATFPNVRDSSEIERAFNNLVNSASQYAWRN